MIAQHLLKRRAKRMKRRVKANNLAKLESALIVYHATDEKQRKAVIDFARFLKEERLKVETLGFYKRKNKQDQLPEDEAGYYYFDKNSIGWLGFPKASKILKLLSKEHQLLIDLNLENLFPLEVISTLSKANFKVGKSQSYQDEVCDMTISTENNEVNYLIEQIKNYLQIINK